ncbi:hypothetical protein B0H13DRAFT_2386595 [Mycena leptocephala]|nr:hypothetical protein B0H13DRAFT_2386595 [Mycena leptocephala]
MAAAQAAAQGRNFPGMIRSYLFVRRACGSVSAGNNEKGSCSCTAHASRSAAPASPAGADAGARVDTRARSAPPCALRALRGMGASRVVGRTVRARAQALPSLAALIACLPSLFATAVAPLAASLLAHHALGIAHNHLAAVYAPPEPPPLATPAMSNVAR